MKTIWTKNAYGKEVQIRDMMCYTDDGFGNLIEAAGSYYNDHPEEKLPYKHMMRVNYVGALYHFGQAEINFH